MAVATEDISVAFDRWRADGRVFWSFQREGKKRGWREAEGEELVVGKEREEENEVECKGWGTFGMLAFCVWRVGRMQLLSRSLSLCLSLPRQGLGDSSLTEDILFDSVSVRLSAFTLCRCFWKTEPLVF